MCELQQVSNHMGTCRCSCGHDPACVIVQKVAEDAQALQSPVMKLLCIAWQARKT